jgi:predicted acylesterase/phospholipase RssA
MGKLVKLEPTVRKGSRSVKSGIRATDSAAQSRSAKRRRGGRARPSKTALVLGGGGFTGGVYEIGALQALDLLAVNSTVNQFDIYVGTSAGAFIAALCANGVTPDEMMRVVTRQGRPPFRDIDIDDLLQLNLLELVRTGALLPLRAASLARQVVSRRRGVSLMDLGLELAEGLPSGVYTGSGIDRYMRKVLSEPGRSNDFRELDRPLYLTATDLDTCERVIFGAEGFKDVPISTAVRASGALPMVYAPVEIAGRELVDGGLLSTSNLDIAVEEGAKLILVINPLVPFVNDFSGTVRTVRGVRQRRVSDMGFPRIGYQAFKLLAHQRLHEQAKHWEERYPGVDIVLIEPEPTDELMFKTSMMNFSSRVDIADHGFRSVTRQLVGEYDRFSEVAKRHGIEISADRVRAVAERFEEEQRPGTDAPEEPAAALSSRESAGSAG